MRMGIVFTYNAFQIISIGHPSDLPKLWAAFPFTSASINRKYAARRHRHSNNIGWSVLKVFGGLNGGELRWWPRDGGRGEAKDDSEQ